LAIILIFAASVFAIEITEVEINPGGSDSGNEWIELFSEEEVNSSEYRILNNDGDEIVLEGVFSEVFVYIFESQWLDNKDEKIFLYKGDDLVFETDVFADEENNDKTWNLCGDWVFGGGSKGDENKCEFDKVDSDVEEESDVRESGGEVEEEVVSVSSEISGEVEENLGEEVIYLAPKNIKSQTNKELVFESKDEKIKKYAIYVFALFCVIIIMFLIRDRS
tara:strand:- start:2415 stop:3077 length:663 start_codon:yes stop_codon:yes gene_type:complete